MKGNPALRTVLVLLLLTAVSYPVVRIINRERHPVTADSPVATSPESPSSVTGTLRIKAVPSPLGLTVCTGGKVLMEATKPTGSGEYLKEITLPAGSDIILRATWCDEQPHALHAEFLPSGTNAPVERDYWCGRLLEDVLSLP